MRDSSGRRGLARVTFVVSIAVLLAACQGATPDAAPLTSPSATAAAGAVAGEARDVRLHRRLGEREVVRAEAHPALLAEERAHQVEQRPLEVGERDPAVDGEPLDLVEDRRVRRVELIGPERPAGADDVHRQRPRQQRAGLDR